MRSENPEAWTTTMVGAISTGSRSRWGLPESPVPITVIKLRLVRNAALEVADPPAASVAALVVKAVPVLRKVAQGDGRARDGCVRDSVGYGNGVVDQCGRHRRRGKDRCGEFPRRGWRGGATEVANDGKDDDSAAKDTDTAHATVAVEPNPGTMAEASTAVAPEERVLLMVSVTGS